jgi:ferredoxin
VAPEVYELDDLGYNVTAVKEVPPGLEEQARKGALACPEQAITIED